MDTSAPLALRAQPDPNRQFQRKKRLFLHMGSQEQVRRRRRGALPTHFPSHNEPRRPATVYSTAVPSTCKGQERRMVRRDAQRGVREEGKEKGEEEGEEGEEEEEEDRSEPSRHKRGGSARLLLAREPRRLTVRSKEKPITATDTAAAIAITQHATHTPASHRRHKVEIRGHELHQHLQEVAQPLLRQWQVSQHQEEHGNEHACLRRPGSVRLHDAREAAGKLQHQHQHQHLHQNQHLHQRHRQHQYQAATRYHHHYQQQLPASTRQSVYASPQHHRQPQRSEQRKEQHLKHLPYRHPPHQDLHRQEREPTELRGTRRNKHDSGSRRIHKSDPDFTQSQRDSDKGHAPPRAVHSALALSHAPPPFPVRSAFPPTAPTAPTAPTTTLGSQSPPSYPSPSVSASPSSSSSSSLVYGTQHHLQRPTTRSRHTAHRTRSRHKHQQQRETEHEHYQPAQQRPQQPQQPQRPQRLQQPQRPQQPQAQQHRRRTTASVKKSDKAATPRDQVRHAIERSGTRKSQHEKVHRGGVVLEVAITPRHTTVHALTHAAEHAAKHTHSDHQKLQAKDVQPTRKRTEAKKEAKPHREKEGQERARRKSEKSKEKGQTATSKADPKVAQAKPKLVSTDEALRQRGLKRRHLLGAGTFGDVYLISPREGADVYSLVTSEASTPAALSATMGASGSTDVPTSYALKVVSKASDQVFLDAVREEALIGFQLSHPHVVRALELFETRRSLCLVLEAGEAGDLYDALHSGRFDCGYAGHTSQVLLQVLAGLEFLHRTESLVHCDVKCENIVLTPAHQAKICDLGACRPAGMLQTVVNGTPEYLSPELVLVLNTDPLERDPYEVTPAIDLWAFGVLCFFVLTHEKPWAFAHPDNDRFCDAVIDKTFMYRPWSTFDETIQRFFAALLVQGTLQRPTHDDIRRMLKRQWANMCRHWRNIHAVTYV